MKNLWVAWEKTKLSMILLSRNPPHLFKIEQLIDFSIDHSKDSKLKYSISSKLLMKLEWWLLQKKYRNLEVRDLNITMGHQHNKLQIDRMVVITYSYLKKKNRRIFIMKLRERVLEVLNLSKYQKVKINHIILLGGLLLSLLKVWAQQL